MIETYIKDHKIRCSGCDCLLDNHVLNITNKTICLTCDCVDGVSASTNRFRAETDARRKEIEAWIENIVSRAEVDETVKAIPCS